MAVIKGIHHVSVDTPDMEKSLDFYINKLGFHLVHREMCDFGDFALVRLGFSAVELIVQSDPEEAHYHQRGTISHFGLDVDNVEEAFELLKSKGVRFLSTSVESCTGPAGGIKFVSLKGPSGEEINLYQFSTQL